MSSLVTTDVAKSVTAHEVINTYTFKEVEAPKGYKLAKAVKYTVKDTGEVQKVSVTDEKQPKPHVPQTGGNTPLIAVVCLFILAGGAWLVSRKKRMRA